VTIFCVASEIILLLSVIYSEKNDAKQNIVWKSQVSFSQQIESFKPFIVSNDFQTRNKISALAYCFAKKYRKIHYDDVKFRREDQHVYIFISRLKLIHKPIC